MFRRVEFIQLISSITLKHALQLKSYCSLSSDRDLKDG